MTTTRQCRGRRSFGAALTAVPVLWCGACATTEPAPDPEQFNVLESIAATGDVIATDLCHLLPGAWTFEYSATAGVDDTPGGHRARVVTTNDRFGADVTVAEGDLRTEFLKTRIDGDVVMPAVIDHDEIALTRFDPPLVVAYATLPAGQPRTAESKMYVLDELTEHQRESGDATQTIEYVGDERIVTPLGEHVAQRVEVRFQAKLKLARAVTNTTYWVVPGAGVVAIEREERVSVLGLPSSREHVHLVRIAPPVGG